MLTKDSPVFQIMIELMNKNMYPIIIIDDKENEFFKSAVHNKPPQLPELEMVIISLTPLTPFQA